jgi:hypothetical protein
MDETTAPAIVTCQNLGCQLPYRPSDSDAVGADAYCSNECEDMAEGFA